MQERQLWRVFWKLHLLHLNHTQFLIPEGGESDDDSVEFIMFEDPSGSEDECSMSHHMTTSPIPDYQSPWICHWVIRLISRLYFGFLSGTPATLSMFLQCQAVPWMLIYLITLQCLAVLSRFKVFLYLCTKNNVKSRKRKENVINCDLL